MLQFLFFLFTLFARSEGSITHSVSFLRHWKIIVLPAATNSGNCTELSEFHINFMGHVRIYDTDLSSQRHWVSILM